MRDYEVLNVTGPGATHHLSDPEGWVYRASYLAQAVADAVPTFTPAERVALGKATTNTRPKTPKTCVVCAALKARCRRCTSRDVQRAAQRGRA